MTSGSYGESLLRGRSVLVLLLAAAFAFRLFLALYAAWKNPGALLEPDSTDYLMLADNISQYFSYSKSGQPEIFRAPAYPALLAAFRMIDPAAILPAIFFQILLDTATCFIVWRMVQRIAPDKPGIAMLSLFLAAFSTSMAVYSIKILSETAFTFCLTLMVLALLVPFNAEGKERAAESGKKSNGSLLLAGILFGAACLLRAVLVPLLPILSLLLLYKTRRFHAMLSFALPALLIIGSWSARNWIITDYRGFSSVSSVNLYRYNGSAVLAHKKGVGFLEQLNKCDSELSQLSSQKQIADFCLREGKKIALENPFLWFRIHLQTSLATFLPAEGDLLRIFGAKIGSNNTLGILRTEGLAAAIRNYFGGKYWPLMLALPGILLLLLKYSMAALGFVVFGFKKPSFTLLMLVLCLWFVFTPGPAALPRFRVPVEPIMAVFAALGTEILISRFRRH